MPAKQPLTYAATGVNIDRADAAKAQMARDLSTSDPVILNTVGAFASLIDARFEGLQHPVLVFKMEEPGSKQKLAMAHGRLESLCYDLVHHLVNDVAVMGARPVAMQDTIVCGQLDPEAVPTIVRALAAACRAQGCHLTGGETSEQPGVLPDQTLVLTASLIGVVDRDQVVDGSAIRPGDILVAVASNGVHTNGYTLIRALLDRDPQLAQQMVGKQRFLEAVLRPHLSYLEAIRAFAGAPAHGLAHITGGGMVDNLRRILPAGVRAELDLSQVRVLPVFDAIRRAGEVSDAEMLRVFNLGVGLLAVVPADQAAAACRGLATVGHVAYPVGRVAERSGDPDADLAARGDVTLTGRLAWASG